MKEGYTDVTVVLDRSGSMAGLQNEVIGGLNSFIKDQREVQGECKFTLVQFDDRYEVNYEGKDINKVPLMSTENYSPRGMTAMYDAIGKTINATGKRLADMKSKNRPEKVIFLIQTDGQENASLEFQGKTIKEMIKKQESKYSWDFVFLGANINAKMTAVDIGISAEKAMDFANNGTGTLDAFSSISKNLTNVRTYATSDMTYDASDYADQREAGVKTSGSTESI